MKSWRVKFRNFLGDLPVHYEALFINTTVNNNYMSLLMVLHHTHDGVWYLFRCYKCITHSSGTLPTLNLSIKIHLSSGSSVFPDVISVSNYHSYIEKPIKLLPCHSFYGGQILPRRIEPPFLAVRLKEIQSHHDYHLAAFP